MIREDRFGDGRPSLRRFLPGLAKVVAVLALLRLTGEFLQWRFDHSFRDQLPAFADEGGLSIAPDYELLDAQGLGEWWFNEPGGMWTFRSEEVSEIDERTAKNHEAHEAMTMSDGEIQIYSRGLTREEGLSGKTFVRSDVWQVDHWQYELFVAEDEKGYWSTLHVIDREGR